MNDHLLPPFYVGQEVVARHPYAGSKIINGQDYVITNCEYKINPTNGLGPFWYVGVQGFEPWLSPKLFTAKIPPMQEISFEKIKQQNPVSVN